MDQRQEHLKVVGRARPLQAEPRPPARPKAVPREHRPVRHPLPPQLSHLTGVQARPDVVLHDQRTQVVHHLRRDFFFCR